MQTIQNIASQAHYVCKPGPRHFRQHPVAAVRWINANIICSPPSPLTRPACNRLLLVCKSTGSSNVTKSMKSGSSKKATTSSSSNPASGGVVIAAATATATTVTDPEAAISINNPPLGFSKPGSSLVNNIVPAAPLSANPTSRNPEDYSSDEELDDLAAAADAGYLASRAAAFRCLILDSRYMPVNVVSWFRAVVMDESGKVDVLEYHPGGYAYSAYKAHPLPAVLRVRTFVDVHEFAGRLSLTRKNIMLRDQFRCQYCGSTQDLTLDHVTPVCRGGVNSWTNLVTACMTCNQRKGDKTLAQIGWKLPRVPREPTPQELGVIAGISKGDLLNPPYPWLPYLATFKQLLEKAQRRAAREIQQSNAAAGAAASNSFGNAGHAGTDATQADLVAVTVHPAGPHSKAAKAAAAAAAMKGKVGKKHR